MNPAHRLPPAIPLLILICVLTGPVAAAQSASPPVALPAAAGQEVKPAARPPAESAQKPAGEKVDESPTGQKGEQKASDSKPAERGGPLVPPETKALRDAQQISDPDKQIEALKKVIADFPKSSAANSAEGLIVSTLTRKTTSDIKALQEQVKKYTDGAATPNEQARRLSSAASGFAGAGVLLDEAEEYAKKSLSLLTDEKAWVDAEKKAAAESQAEVLKRDPKAKPRPAVSDSDYASRFTAARQSGMMTLAQIYEKKGRASDAEKTYRDAYALSPRTGGAAALKLAEYAKAAGHPFEQLEYLTVATLAGRVTAASRSELEAVYTQTRGGSAADLDRMLDERYEKEATKVDAPPYKPAKARTDRVVLAELFTGAGCPPCVAADLAFEAALERYAPKDLAVLVYHLHVPRPDPMTNLSTVTRKEFYDVPGTPTYFIDGGSQHVGGGTASGAAELFKNSVQSVIDKRLDVRPAASIGLRAAMAGDAVEVAASVRKAGGADRKLRLHLALVEEMVHYTGENGVRFHPMVVRSMARADQDALGFPLVPGRPAKVAYVFDVAKVVEAAAAHLDDMEGGSSQRFGTFQFVERKSDINRDSLRVVAWVQDDTTKEVLQAVTSDLKPAAPKAH